MATLWPESRFLMQILYGRMKGAVEHPLVDNNNRCAMVFAKILQVMNAFFEKNLHLCDNCHDILNYSDDGNAIIAISPHAFSRKFSQN
jgi:hypothetical protein